MNTITFVTGNDRKLGEARKTCNLFNITVEQETVEINEIQSSDAQQISEHKARSAYSELGKPLVVTDTFWGFPALRGFPGAYMKEVVGWFDEQDFIRLLKDKEDKRIFFIESITYFDSSEIKRFSNTYWGVLVTKPRGTGNSLENIAEFEGVTLGERHEQGSYSHEPKDYVWYDFAEWYSAL